MEIEKWANIEGGEGGGGESEGSKNVSVPTKVTLSLLRVEDNTVPTKGRG